MKILWRRQISQVQNVNSYHKVINRNFAGPYGVRSESFRTLLEIFQKSTRVGSAIKVERRKLWEIVLPNGRRQESLTEVSLFERSTRGYREDTKGDQVRQKCRVDGIDGKGLRE